MKIEADVQALALAGFINSEHFLCHNFGKFWYILAENTITISSRISLIHSRNTY